jgi:hypothetical protein
MTDHAATESSTCSFAKLDAKGNLATNFDRWRTIGREDSKWHSRYEMLVRYVRPFDRVLELGCGSQHLRGLLHETCRYTPTDVIQRTPDCHVVDLNSSSLPSLAAHDICIAAGVFEYVADVSAVIDWACSLADSLAFSYCTTNDYPSIEKRHFEYGWFSHLTHDALLASCSTRGISCTRVGRWHRQNLYFARRQS